MTAARRAAALFSSMLAAAAVGCAGDGGSDGSEDQRAGASERDGDGDDGGDDGGDSGSGSGNLRVRVENVAPWTLLKSAALAEHADGSTGPAGPGQAFEIRLTAGKQQALSFAAMLGESNDWFFAPGPEGIALFDEQGNPRSGDVTSEVALWDAGTEVDQEPAVGPDTAPQQAAPDQGAPDPDPAVSVLSGQVELSDGTSFALPAVEEMVRVTLTPGADGEFVLRIENVSTEDTLQTSQGDCAIHVSPLAWALHMMPAPLFEEGEPDRGLGLERIAEEGNPAPLAESLEELTGFATPISPGVFVVHGEGEPIYTIGQPDRDQGLERIAEEGNPAPLAESLEELTGFATPISPGVFVVHGEGEPIYTFGQPDRDQGLERIAEDGNAMPLGEALAESPPEGASQTGVFDTAVGASMPGPALPGQAFEFEIDAREGDRLSFAAMYGMSNDWIFATPAEGIELRVGRDASEGDVTEQIAIYDAGTEIDQEIAIGSHTAPQQPAPNTGPPDPNKEIRAADYPVPTSAHLRVTITPAD
jgi:hypothetical protein